jgi:hypothetical protein
MPWLGKLGFVRQFVRQTIRKKKRLPRKHSRTNPRTDRHPKQKPSTSKQNKIRLQALTDQISQLQDKLAAASDLQKTTIGRYDEKHVSLQASTLENTELKRQLALAHETIRCLQVDFEQSEEMYKETKRQIQDLENKMTQSSWYKQDLADLMRLYDECAYDKNMLEYHIRQRAAEEEVLKHHPNLRDPITMEMIRNPVQMPPPCICTCVFNYNMLDELYHKGYRWSNRCPNCRETYLFEDLQPAHCLAEVIKTLVAQEMTDHTELDLKTVVSRASVTRSEHKTLAAGAW